MPEIASLSVRAWAVRNLPAGVVHASTSINVGARYPMAAHGPALPRSADLRTWARQHIYIGPWVTDSGLRAMSDAEWVAARAGGPDVKRAHVPNPADLRRAERA